METSGHTPVLGPPGARLCAVASTAHAAPFPPSNGAALLDSSLSLPSPPVPISCTAPNCRVAESERGLNSSDDSRHTGTQSLFSGQQLLWEAACARSLSGVQLLTAAQTAARQAPLSRRVSRQEHWGGSPMPPPGGLPDPGTEPVSPVCLHWLVDPLPLNHLGSLTGGYMWIQQLAFVIPTAAEVLGDF